jgi:diamine N-acetyltransferase
MITGDKVILRKLSTEDAIQILLWENNPNTWRYSGREKPFSIAEIEDFIASSDTVKKSKQLRLMICDHKKEKVGLVDLFDINFNHKRAAIGILIAAKYRKKGYAEESIRILMKYAFHALDINNFHCTIQNDNNQSIALFEKLKFERVGERKQWYKIDGNWINEYFYQRIIKHYD